MPAREQRAEPESSNECRGPHLHSGSGAGAPAGVKGPAFKAYPPSGLPLTPRSPYKAAEFRASKAGAYQPDPHAADRLRP